MLKKTIMAIGLIGFAIPQGFADTKTVTIYATMNNKQSLGTVTFKNSPYGVLIEPKLKGLSQGLHGFHLHEKPSCDDHAMAAGSHYDPHQTNMHLGPYDNKGHLGDLPVLYVDASGEANVTVLAPKLSMDDLHDLSIMIHQGGDNYQNNPPLGGGGKRVGCGVIKRK